MGIWRVHKASLHFENLNPHLWPKAVLACLLILTYLHLAKQGMRGILGDQRRTTSLRAADSLITTKVFKHIAPLAHLRLLGEEKKNAPNFAWICQNFTWVVARICPSSYICNIFFFCAPPPPPPSPTPMVLNVWANQMSVKKYFGTRLCVRANLVRV